MKKAVMLSLLLIFLFAGFPAVAETNGNGPAPLAVFRIGMGKYIVNDLVKKMWLPLSKTTGHTCPCAMWLMLSGLAIIQ